MFFSRKKSKSGQVLQLLQSYRNDEGKSRHRVIVSLGDASLSKSSWGVVASHVESILGGSSELFEAADEEKVWIDQIVKRIERKGFKQSFSSKAKDSSKAIATSEVVNGVLIDNLNHSHESSLGGELLGLFAWNELNMDGLLQGLHFNQSQRHAACVSVINRLIDPVPEHALNDWLSTSSLADLFGDDFHFYSSQGYYRAGDKLLKHSKKIESHLRKAIDFRFNFERTILLYDLTNSHFEGSCQLNGKAKRGRNKQKRHDCPQVVVGVCFDENGFIQFHKTFSGNTGDSTTLVEMVEQMESNADDLLSTMIKPMVIVDAGIATQKNLSVLRSKGFDYLVNDTRSKRTEFLENFKDDSKFSVLEGRNGKPPVKIQVLNIEKVTEESIKQDNCPKNASSCKDDPSVEEESDTVIKYKERVVLCRSNQRAAKESGIRSGAETKFLKGLENLSKRIEKGQLKDPVKIERAIGKIQGRHTRIARYYDVKMEERCVEKQIVCAKPEMSNDRASSTEKKKKGKNPKPAVCRYLTWTREDEDYESSDELFGCYVLRSNRQDIAGDKLWHLYMTLSKAEAGFRALKSNLGLRPIYHHLEGRVDAHIFITIIAYQLLNFLLYSLSKCGDKRSWPRLKRVLQTHTYSTIHVPTTNSELYRIRKAGIPEACQQDIYNKLGIDYVNLPKSKIKIQKTPTTL